MTSFSTLGADAPRALEIAMLELGETEPSLMAMGHAVEALLVLHPDLTPETGLWWVGTKNVTMDAFAIAMRMSGAVWDVSIAQRIIGAIRYSRERHVPAPVQSAPTASAAPIAAVASARGPASPYRRIIDHRPSSVEVTAALMGDPSPERSALHQRKAAS